MQAGGTKPENPDLFVNETFTLGTRQTLIAMPSLETPPNSAPPTQPIKVRTGRFGELEEHELIHLLDSLDDERAKARFRESI